MIDAGDVCLSDLGGEVRERALVLSSRRLHRLAGRAIVAPAQLATGSEHPPWWVTTPDGTIAVDQLLTVPVARLLEPVGRAMSSELARALRALRAIS